MFNNCLCVDQNDNFEQRTNNRFAFMIWQNQEQVGTISAFAGARLPEGWLLCDGSAHSRGDYPVLAGILETMYGTAPEQDKFLVPNFCGRVGVGADTTRNLGDQVGSDNINIALAQTVE